MDSHEPGQNHPHDDRDQGQRVILLADHFVIETEDVLADKAGGWRVMLYVGRRL
jgi:hypothetical protein